MDETASIPTVEASLPPSAGPSRLLLAVIGVAIALVAGVIGGLVGQTIFPAKNGARGPHGDAGPMGPQGPAGSAATIQTLDTNKVGYCFDTSSTYDSNYPINIVTNVSLSPPTDTGGTLSCPSGTFVALTPNGPNGTPVANYNPSGAASG